MAVFAYGRLEGAQDVIRALQDFGDEIVQEKMREAVKAGAEVVAEDARTRAPMGTREPRKGAGVGRLKASIKVKMTKRGISAKVEADYPRNAGTRKSTTKKQKAGSKEYYAFAVEYGTRKMEAQPFMAPALAAKTPAVWGKMERALEEACREAQKSV
jgi:HK97 gp10 family phage protein